MNVVTFHRISQRLAFYKVPIIPGILDRIIRLVFTCWLSHKTKTGTGLILGYGGLAIVVHSDAVIGSNVHIDQCVTIGGNARQLGVPVIEDNVYIGAGAKILGPITIGEGSIIGANAVVTKDVPPRSVAVGVPARIVKSNININEYLYHRSHGK